MKLWLLGRRWLLALALTPLLGGCAAAGLASAVAGAAITVGGAVVSTTVKVGGSVVGAAVDAVTPERDAKKDGSRD